MIRTILALLLTLLLSSLAAQSHDTAVISARSLLARGRKANRESNTETALALYNEAIRVTVSQNDAQGFSEAIVAKANLFIRVKQIDSVIAVFDYGAQKELSWRNKHYEIELLTFKAQSLKLIGEREIAFVEYQRLIPYAKSEPRLQSIAMQDFGALQFQLYDRVDSAKYYMELSFIISKELNDSIRLSSILEAQGNLHARLGQQLSATECYIEAINYVLPKNIYKKYLLLKGVGLLFKDIGQLEKAQDYTHMALALAIEKKYSRAKAVAQNQLGTIEQELGKSKQALEYYDSAHAYFISKTNYNDIVDVTCNIASLVLETGQFELAENYLNDIEPNIEIAEKEKQSKFWRIKAQLFLDKNQPHVALKYLTHALQLAAVIENIPEEIKCLQLLKTAYAYTGNYKLAYEAGEAHQYLRDSIIQLRQSQLLFDTEARYQKAEQDRAIAQLNADNAIKDLHIAQDGRQRMALLAGLLLLGTISILIYRTARIKSANNAMLHEKNATIAKALTEKETLLKEIHHRVKNNLQVVSSLLTLQSHHMEDESVKEAIQEGRNRVASMGLIHQNLYQEDNLKGIDMQEYFKKLIDSLFHSYNVSPDKVRLTSKVDRLNLDVDTVIPLALILNELITNALKYAFTENEQGHLHVELCQHDASLHLLVQDDGVGFPAGMKMQQSDSFGYELIGMFAEKLEAEIEILNGKGAGILLKISNYKIAN